MKEENGWECIHRLYLLFKFDSFLVLIARLGYMQITHQAYYTVKLAARKRRSNKGVCEGKSMMLQVASGGKRGQTGLTFGHLLTLPCRMWFGTLGGENIITWIADFIRFYSFHIWSCRRCASFPWHVHWLTLLGGPDYVRKLLLA